MGRPRQTLFAAILLSVLIFFGRWSFALENVTILNVRSVSLEGPIHHGLQVETEGIRNPNLSFYEIQIKPDGSGPFAPWQVYNMEVQPYDSRLINLPYRNGIVALPSDVVYCVRVRAILGREVSSWAERCGVTLATGSTQQGDSDNDGLNNDREFALGLDPQDRDSDRDNIDDHTEVTQGSDPSHAYAPHLFVRTPSLDFGEGDPFGGQRRQHQFVMIENNGEEQAEISDVRLVDDGIIGSAQAFHVGAYSAISHIPPRNILRLPVSFLPTRRGAVRARLEIFLGEAEESSESVSLTGSGVVIPDCRVTPQSIDFGTVRADDIQVLKQDILIRNMPEISSPEKTSFGFTLHSTVDGVAPGIRGFVLPQGEEIRIPVLFQHPHAGNYEGFLEIHSAYCGVQKIAIRGVAE